MKFTLSWLKEHLDTIDRRRHRGAADHDRPRGQSVEIRQGLRPVPHRPRRLGREALNADWLRLRRHPGDGTPVQVVTALNARRHAWEFAPANLIPFPGEA
jgi:hypothetical protein